MSGMQATGLRIQVAQLLVVRAALRARRSYLLWYLERKATAAYRHNDFANGHRYAARWWKVGK